MTKPDHYEPLIALWVCWYNQVRITVWTRIWHSTLLTQIF